jgi:hypothetical protein
MTFDGFDREAIAELRALPGLDAVGYARCRERLRRGLLEPARAFLDELVNELGEPLTIARGSISPLHTDLRFVPAGAPRYKDHLLMTAWHGPDKKAGPTLWVRIDSDSVGFASGVAFTPRLRETWRNAVGGSGGARLASQLDDLRARHSRHELDVAGEELQRVPPPWPKEHPRADLLRKTGFQVRFRLPLPREVEGSGFVAWCAAALGQLLPTHRWLVKHLYGKV